MEIREIALESLLLDPLNPRHDPVESQSEAIDAFLSDKIEGPKIVRLAQHIAKHGPSPIDLALVVPENGLFIVVEGNRRVLAMKLLRNPDLAENARIRKAVYDASRDSVPLEAIECVIAPSRDEANLWVELRHNGEQQGIGVVTWGALEKARFTRNREGHAGKGMQLTDALKEVYRNDSELLDLILNVRKSRLTTLGRLASDPNFRGLAGIDRSGQDITSYFPAASMRDFWYRLFYDLSNELSVSSLKSKEQRAEYLGTLADVTPPAEARQAGIPLTAEPAVAAPGTVADTGTPQRQTRAARPRPLRLFHGLALRNVKSHKAKDVLHEAQRINLTEFPNAGAVLIRVLVELVVAEAVDHYRLSSDDPLWKQVRACLDRLDPGGKTHKYAAVRQGLSDPNSLLAVRTMNAYVHNTFLHPDAASLRSISENYVPFLSDLDDALGSDQQP